jgi:hypothetical protein
MGGEVTKFKLYIAPIIYMSWLFIGIVASVLNEKVA